MPLSTVGVVVQEAVMAAIVVVVVAVLEVFVEGGQQVEVMGLDLEDSVEELVEGVVEEEVVLRLATL